MDSTLVGDASNVDVSLSSMPNRYTHLNVNVDLNVQVESVDDTTMVEPFSHALRSLDEVRSQYTSHADAILDYDGSAPKKVKG